VSGKSQPTIVAEQLNDHRLKAMGSIRD